VQDVAAIRDTVPFAISNWMIPKMNLITLVSSYVLAKKAG